MSVALCAHRFPDGTFCKRRALAESRFCGYHRPEAVRVKFPRLHPPDFEEHADVHPLARLTDMRDAFNVVRETLNAARQGRIPPGQVYAVACMLDRWLKFHDRMQYEERQQALDSQYVAKVVEAEQEMAAEREAAPPLPVKIDQKAAVEQVAATVKLDLKPPTDYPGYSESQAAAASSGAANLARPCNTRTSAPTKPTADTSGGEASLAPTKHPAGTTTAAPRKTGRQSAANSVAATLTRKLLEEAFRPLRGNGKNKRSPPG